MVGPEGTVTGADISVPLVRLASRRAEEAAVATVRDHMHHGDRLTFACWQTPDQNPWFFGPALTGLVPPPSPLAPGRSPTGPFSLADAARTAGLLTAAGWSDVSQTCHEVTATVGADTLIDDAHLSFLGVPSARLDDARTAVDAHLAPLLRTDGDYNAPLTFQIFDATA